MIRDYYLSCHSTFHDFFQECQNGIDKVLEGKVLNYDQEHNRFIQALMLESGWTYIEQNSGVFNLFSADRQERTSHFLILRILAYLSLDENVSSTRNLVKCEKIFDDFIFLGYQRHHINAALRRLFQFGLIVSPNLPANIITERKVDVPDHLPPNAKILISPKGYYYLNKLVRNYYYQTRVAEDTIWYDENLANLYINCLKESIENQDDFGKDDALIITEACELFVHYLKQCMIGEDQISNIRTTSKEWARLVNDIVERSIFGEQITRAVYKDDTGGPETTGNLQLNPSASQATTSEYRKSIVNSLNPVQMILFDTSPDYDRAIREVIQSLCPMPKNEKWQNSVYIVRILWALEVAARAGLGPLRAGEIAKLIRDYGNEAVEGSNVAYFFRKQRRRNEFTHFWKEEPEQHYTISSIGRTTLQSILKVQIRYN